MSAPVVIGGCSITADARHPYLVDEWTVSGQDGSFAVIKVYAPPDANGRPSSPCVTLQRAREDASFVREGWLARERKRVADYKGAA
jgi:hypothetical protein